ncbi:hypothetical protein IE81DRAFT_325580 [Ceraceosorus guamensis]|uniref:CDP-diacylglycerol--glycerol-3-phosphate 3-phosphatidyltransferase n=1 Tax=Ceraceosorus guamensis TaxID=1522189 RepID=A0A316VVS9_9BASI|nr:hypothetical protein IE81DRAFT_325580 [Ceraceosorus guamensis]PWN40411.1 hypothetical protein IE81DRAFT_325580 [Ceraceosorus guamensis]
MLGTTDLCGQLFRLRNPSYRGAFCWLCEQCPRTGPSQRRSIVSAGSARSGQSGGKQGVGTRSDYAPAQNQLGSRLYLAAESERQALCTELQPYPLRLRPRPRPSHRQLCTSASTSTHAPSSLHHLSSAASSHSAQAHSDSLARHVSQSARLPLFRSKQEDVRLLCTPQQFYNEVLGMISSAKEEVTLASLYLGSNEGEIVEALRTALTLNPRLRVTFLLDYQRSTREGRYVSSDARSQSAASLLSPLVRDFGSKRVNVRLYRAPGLSKWMERLVGKRLVEGWGLQHVKIYLADGRALISGANLSADYFTNRQDRYVHFDQAHAQGLSLYLRSLVRISEKYSYSLRCMEPRRKESSEARPNPDPRLSSDVESDADEKTLGHQAQRLRLRREVRAEHAPYEVIWTGRPGYLDDAPADVSRGVNKVEEKNWSALAKAEIVQFNHEWFDKTSKQLRASGERGDEIAIVPLVQMAPLGIRDETRFVHLLPEWMDRLAISSPSSSSSSAPTPARGMSLTLTSGYFCLSPSWTRTILRLSRSFKVDILAASPRSNGFFGSKGISRHLPPAYTFLEWLFWKRAEREGVLGELMEGEEKGVRMKEWTRHGWTYHAKGIWLSRDANTDPFVTLIGSSNFGNRSDARDLECTLLVEDLQACHLDAGPLARPTKSLALEDAEPQEIERERKSSSLSSSLSNELKSLELYATDQVSQELFERRERKVHWGVKLTTRLIRGLL